jgi:hypothetical protein
MVKIKFCYRPKQRKGVNEGYLNVQIFYDNKVQNISTKYHLFADEWDKKRNCLIFPDKDSPRRDYLTELQDNMESDQERLAFLVGDLKSEGDNKIRAAIREFYGKKDKTLFSIFVKEQVIKSKQIGQGRSADVYRSMYLNMMRFTKNQDLYLDQITTIFVKRYKLYLEESGYAPHTICFYLRNLRAIFRKGIKEGKLSKYTGNPFRNIQTTVYPAPDKHKLDTVFLRNIDLACEQISNLVGTANPYLRSNRKNA